MKTLSQKPFSLIRWLSLITLITLACLVWAYSHAHSSKMTQWRNIAPGVQYTTLNLNPGTLHAFKIDLQHNRLTLLSPSQPSDIKTMATHAHALLAVNGGFFTPTGQPLGLRIDDKKTLSPLKPISWWGIFYIQHGIPTINGLREFTLKKDIDFAVQSGPRLLINKNIPRLKDGNDNRTAIGYNHDNRVIIVMSEGAQLTTQQLAKVLRRSERHGGLGCVFALNLDGGSSSQVYSHVGNFTLDVPNYRAIADGVAVVAK